MQSTQKGPLCLGFILKVNRLSGCTFCLFQIDFETIFSTKTSIFFDKKKRALIFCSLHTEKLHWDILNAD